MMKIMIMLAGSLFAAASVAYVAGPQVEPPQPDAAIHSPITSFAGDHPEWRLLQSERIDTTPLRMGHAFHMDPGTPQMQERFTEWVKQLRADGVADAQIPVQRLEDGRLTLTCTACHQSDAAGAYMQPISFASHCMQCHSLGSRDGDPVPHGELIHGFMERKTGEAALGLNKPAPPPSRAGPGGRGPARGPGRAPAAAEQGVTFASQEAMDEALAEKLQSERERLYNAIVGQRCLKCHMNINDVRAQTPGQDWSKLDWAKVDPHIPQRWLPRSHFSHKAHRMMNCVECHTQAGVEAEATEYESDDPHSIVSKLTWTGATRDIMLPGVQSCRECHQPQGNVRHDCMVCHQYHKPDVAPDHGGAFPGGAVPQPRRVQDFLRK